MGRKTINELILNAETVFTLSGQADDETAYECLGNYLLDDCDAPVAIWNGKPYLKKGGTGWLATKALQTGREINWIYADIVTQGTRVINNAKKKTGDIELLYGIGNSISK